MGNTYSMLTRDILPLILIHVDRRTLRSCAVVNRQFHRATMPLLLQTIDLSENQAITFMNTLVTTNRFLSHWIHHLHLKGFAFNDPLLLLVMRQTPSIVSVVLDSGTQITDRSMQYVPYYWTKLKSIQLTGSTMTHFNVFNNVLHLELWGCSGLDRTTFATHFAVETLVIDMHDTLALNLAGLVHLRDLRVYGGLSRGSHGWPASLNSLYLVECVDWMDQDVLPLVRSCPRLTHLTLQDGIFTDILLAIISMYLFDLEHLDLSYNDQLTARGVRQFVNQVHALRLFTLTYCGITMTDFPEAGYHCAGHVVTTSNTLMRLNHLDTPTLCRIRHSQMHN